MNGQGEKPTIEEVIDFCTLCLKGARYQARKAEAENWSHDLSSFHGARHAFESVIDFCHGKNDFDVYLHQRNKKGNNHGDEHK